MKLSTARWIMVPILLAFIAIMSYILYPYVQLNPDTWNAEATRLIMLAGITFVFYLMILGYVSGLPYREGNRRATKIFREQKRQQRAERERYEAIRERHRRDAERSRSKRRNTRHIVMSSTPR